MSSGEHMRPCVIWGVTGQGKVVFDILRDENVSVIHCFDNNRDLTSPFPNVPISYGEDGVSRFLSHLSNSGLTAGHIDSVIAIGGGRGPERRSIGALMSAFGFLQRQVVHRSSVISSRAKIGLACQVMAGATVGPWATIGEHVIINTGANIDHDCVVKDCSHIGPHAALAGEVIIGENVFIGTNATVLPRIKVGDGSTVGAGAVVTRDVPPNSVVVGIPARVVESKATH